VLSKPRLRSNTDIANFFLREGTFSSGTVLETLAAGHVGRAIAAEAKRSRKNR